ncbi:MAG: glutamate--tRNA ligase, partial [Nanoarchaeota archaeon]|nr:glutamate--tRNA ligase [Nanoarchaeota archaeon]
MEDIIYKFALQNAIKFKGKANPGAVIGKVISEDPKSRGNELAMKVQEIVKKVNSMKVEEQL